MKQRNLKKKNDYRNEVKRLTSKIREIESISADIYQAVGYIGFSLLEKDTIALDKISESDIIALLDNICYISGIKKDVPVRCCPFPKNMKSE